MILGGGVASFGWQMVRSVISVAVIIQMHLGVTISEQLSSASGATNWSAVKLFPILPFSLKFELHWPFKGILCQKFPSLKFHIGVWYSRFWLEGFQQNCKSTFESSALSKNIWCINTLHPSDLVLMEAFYNICRLTIIVECRTDLYILNPVSYPVIMIDWSVYDSASQSKMIDQLVLGLTWMNYQVAHST